MITYEQAIRAVLDHAFTLPTRPMRTEKALGYVLAEATVANHDSPLFDNSAVDGFGVRTTDIQNASPETPVRLRLIGTIRAGDVVGDVNLQLGCAMKILTGAAVPPGIDAVVMKEFAEVGEGHVRLTRPAERGENIRRKGEEYISGSRALEPGVRITPAVVGLLAALGYASCKVYRKPKVTLICTGNELVSPGEALKPGQIYDSNSYALAAALKEMGIEADVVTRVVDDKEPLKQHIGKALQQSDVVITVGGISVGDYDFVKDVMAELKVQTVFSRVAIKPGKPNFFGTYVHDGAELTGKKLVFGLPGNPVSALCSYHQFIRPALLKMMGLDKDTRMTFEAILGSDLKKKAGRLEFVRGILSTQGGKWVVHPTRAQGSHMIGGLAQANCLIHFPLEQERISKGASVTVQWMTW